MNLLLYIYIWIDDMTKYTKHYFNNNNIYI